MEHWMAMTHVSCWISDIKKWMESHFCSFISIDIILFDEMSFLMAYEVPCK